MAVKSEKVILSFRTSKGKVKNLDDLIREEEVSDRSDTLETALTLLLDRYGKLGKEGE